MTIYSSQYNFSPVLTPVRVASVANLSATYLNGTLNNGVGATLIPSSVAALTIDGVSLEQGDRVLLISQTNTNENGIYVVTDAGSASSVWILTRSSDQQSIEQYKLGQYVSVFAGTANAGSMYSLVEPLPAHLGVDSVIFESAQSPGGGDVTFSDVTVTSTLTVPNNGLHILDTNSSHDLIVTPGSNLTVDNVKTLSAVKLLPGVTIKS